MTKRARQREIRSLVAEGNVSTQAELVGLLRTRGHDAVQTTVSRDIAELGLAKVRAPSGRLVYAVSGTGDADRPRVLGSALRRYVRSIEAAGSLVVVTTPAGCASALAQAIDESGHPAVAGTIAGDNTVFVAARDVASARSLAGELSDLAFARAA